MQAQTQTAKGELLYEIKGNRASWTIKEANSSGIKMEMNDEGTVNGKYNANFIETIAIHMKTDGTSEWEGRGIQTAGQDMIVATGKGKGRTSSPGVTSWEGEMHFMTQSPKLSWLNNTKGWIEGTANMADNNFTAKVYAKK